MTDWDPLTVWFFEECYIRFAAEDYEMGTLKNKFMHLTNNSIAKYSKQWKESHIEGNMWDTKMLNDHLKVRLACTHAVVNLCRRLRARRCSMTRSNRT